jgi:hypothetical protein
VAQRACPEGAEECLAQGFNPGTHQTQSTTNHNRNCRRQRRRLSPKAGASESRENQPKKTQKNRADNTPKQSGKVTVARKGIIIVVAQNYPKQPLSSYLRAIQPGVTILGTGPIQRRPLRVLQIKNVNSTLQTYSDSSLFKANHLLRVQNPRLCFSGPWAHRHKR